MLLSDLAGLLAWLAAEHLPIDYVLITINSGIIIQQENDLVNGQW